GDQLVIETTVHAAGKNAAETQALLSGMKWVKGRDAKGREEWALSYPVDDYRGFYYPDSRSGEEPSFFGGLYQGEKVRVYGNPRAGVPTLYADVRIAVPESAKLFVRNVVGAVGGGALRGDVSIDTGCGDVKVASFEGHLSIDTGSGDIKVGT